VKVGDNAYDFIPDTMTWVGRLYGMAILALGGVCLYWGTRGFVAFFHGVRADWSDPRAWSIALVIAGLSFWVAYHVLTNPVLARGFARGGRSLDELRARPIRWNLGTVALLAGFGGVILLAVALYAWGDTAQKVFGTLELLAGLGILGTTWRLRSHRDPAFEADLQKAMTLRDTDPTASDRLIETALTEARSREDQLLADLRHRAATDMRAAKELRSRLRAKVRIQRAARRRAEKRLLAPAYRTALLQVMDRDANATIERLAEVENIIDNLRRSR
jgi:hypothetical protein